MLVMALPNHAGDGTAEEILAIVQCRYRVMLAMVLLRQCPCRVMLVMALLRQRWS
jgi:hypothetical protein